MNDAAGIPDPLPGLRHRVVELETELARAQGVIELLRGLLSKLNRALFGRRTEGVDLNQLELLLQDGTQVIDPNTEADSREQEPTDGSKLKAAPRRNHNRGNSAIRIPENLEVIEEVLNPEEVERDPTRWRLIGQEITETLDLIQSRFVKRRLIRNKFVPVDDDQSAPVVAPAPKRLIDGGMVEAALLSQIAVNKYCDLTTFGCWAHVRRKFFDALVQAPQTGAWILRRIQWMYQWEGQLRGSRAGPAERARVRASHHRMVLDRLLVVFKKLQPRFTPKSLTGQALGYALNQWETLVRFVDYGEVEIDNNLVENAIRPLALGRRNWLFFGSPEGGRRAAIVCSLLVSCKNLGIEPLSYLKAVIERLPEMTNQNIGELTPRNWLRQHGRNLPETPGN